MIAWLRAWLSGHLEDPIDDLIKPPRQVYARHDDALRERSEQRRASADRIARRAAAVASGSRQRPLERAARVVTGGEKGFRVVR